MAAEYFCEKALYIKQYDAHQDPDVIFNLYPRGVRSIYLVRDPRDIFCSNRAFFHTGPGRRSNNYATLWTGWPSTRTDGRVLQEEPEGKKVHRAL